MDDHIKYIYSVKKFGTLIKHQFGYYIESTQMQNGINAGFDLINFNLDVLVQILASKYTPKSRLNHISGIIQWCSYEILKNQNRGYKDLYLKLKFQAAKHLALSSNRVIDKEIISRFSSSFESVIDETDFRLNFHQIINSDFCLNLFLILRINSIHSSDKKSWQDILILFNNKLAQKVVVPIALLNTDHLISFQLLLFFSLFGTDDHRFFTNAIANFRRVIFMLIFRKANFFQNARFITRAKANTEVFWNLIRFRSPIRYTIYEKNSSSGLNSLYNLDLFDLVAPVYAKGKIGTDVSSLTDNMLRMNFPLFMGNKSIDSSRFNDFVNQRIRNELHATNLDLLDTDIQILICKERVLGNTGFKRKKILHFGRESFSMSNNFEILSVMRGFFLFSFISSRKTVEISNIREDYFFLLGKIKVHADRSILSFDVIYDQTVRDYTQVNFQSKDFYIGELLKKKIII